MRRSLLLSLLLAFAGVRQSEAGEPPRIVVVLAELAPSGARMLRMTIGEVLAADAAEALEAMSRFCDGHNDERGDHVVLLAREDMTLGNVQTALNIATKPCHDARRVTVFTFDRGRTRVDALPQSAAGVPALFPFSVDPEAYRPLIGE